MLKKLIITILLFNTIIYASGFAVVVSKQSELSKLSKKQIKDIFLMKRHFVNGIKMIPVNITASSELRVKFEKDVLKIDRDKLNRYWVKQHFQGISPPVVQSSDTSMKLFIKNVKGAIGYIPTLVVDSELRVLYEF